MEQFKNRHREPFSFANINLLGACNVDCFFCLGKDIKAELAGQNQLGVYFSLWRDFDAFLNLCRVNRIQKLYITGQNTDSLLYHYLGELIDFLHARGFSVGLRTNGYLALHKMEQINRCDLSVGYSIHTLDNDTNTFIMGRGDIPPWGEIIPATRHPRVQIVANRYNRDEFFQIVRYAASFPNVRYIQARRISTDRRVEELWPDMADYEMLHRYAAQLFPFKGVIWGDCAVYDAYGKDLCFWRTVLTTVNSMNYFTDGTISNEYFVVEGYLKNRSS